jgi:hypothetical protein
MAALQARYKQLVRVFHPDRFQSPGDKEFAENELKKLNSARELIEQYLCSLAGAAPAQPVPKPKPKPGPKSGPKPEPEPKPMPKPKPKPEPEPEPEPPQPAPQPGNDSRSERIMAVLMAFAQEWLRQVDKKYPLEKVLTDFGAPFKATKDTKKRRFWCTLIFLLLLEGAICRYIKGEPAPHSSLTRNTLGRSKDPKPSPNQTQYDAYRNQLSVSPPVVAQTDLTAIKSRQEKQYFLRLQLDRDQRGIQLNSNSISQIEAALTNRQLAIAERNLLLALKQNHERCLRFAQQDLAATARELAALSATQLQTQF